jgi:hypothetical protein
VLNVLPSAAACRCRLLQELVNTKVELAEVKEQQLITQRQLYQAQAALRRATGAE